MFELPRLHHKLLDQMAKALQEGKPCFAADFAVEFEPPDPRTQIPIRAMEQQFAPFRRAPKRTGLGHQTGWGQQLASIDRESAAPQAILNCARAGSHDVAAPAGERATAKRRE